MFSSYPIYTEILFRKSFPFSFFHFLFDQKIFNLKKVLLIKLFAIKIYHFYSSKLTLPKWYNNNVSQSCLWNHMKTQFHFLQMPYDILPLNFILIMISKLYSKNIYPICYVGKYIYFYILYVLCFLVDEFFIFFLFRLSSSLNDMSMCII